MKNILVPTDFSHCAEGAVEAGIALAKSNNAKLYLYTCLDLPEDWNNLSEEEQKQFPEALQTIRNAEILFNELKARAIAKNIEVESLWSSGKLTREIERHQELYEIDFMIIGSHGASGKNEYLMGSNAQKMVRTVHCPVLIIKDPLENYQFDKVVFASNFDLKEKSAFRYFLEFVQEYQPEIHLVEVNTSSFFGQPYVLVKEAMKDFQEMALPLKTHCHFYRDFNIDSGVRNLTDELGAKLIGISNQTRHPLKRIFSGSNVEALANHAKVPVLSIDFSKNTKMEDPVSKDSDKEKFYS